MFSRVVGIIFLGGLLAGCAVGNKVEYRSQFVSLNTGSEQTIALGVQDLRPYILSGNKTPQFVGIQRGGYGNPFDVLTASGASLAQDLTGSIASGLRRGGATVETTSFSGGETTQNATKQLLALNAEKFLLVSYREWKTDSMVNTSLIYDITAQVFGKDGTVLAQNQLSGNDRISGSVMGDQSRASASVPAAVGRKLQLLLGHEDIRAALQ